MTASRRIAIVLLLLAATAGLCVVEAGTADERWPYPTTEAVVTDYDAAVGQEVFLTGTVAESPNSDDSLSDGEGATVHVTVEHDERERTLAVGGATVDLQPGATVQVLGTLQPADAVDAERVVVVNATQNAALQKWGLSLVAVGLFVVPFARHWRVDVRKLRVEGRTDG